MAEDCRGTWLRLTMYTGAFTGIGVALERSGVNFETAVILTAGIMIPTMAAGELYLMDRLAERLPWLSVHHTSFRKRW